MGGLEPRLGQCAVWVIAQVQAVLGSLHLDLAGIPLTNCARIRDPDGQGCSRTPLGNQANPTAEGREVFAFSAPAALRFGWSFLGNGVSDGQFGPLLEHSPLRGAEAQLLVHIVTYQHEAHVGWRVGHPTLYQ
jgi:hypothetical protein